MTNDRQHKATPPPRFIVRAFLSGALKPDIKIHTLGIVELGQISEKANKSNLRKSAIAEISHNFPTTLKLLAF